MSRAVAAGFDCATLRDEDFSQYMIQRYRDVIGSTVIDRSNESRLTSIKDMVLDVDSGKILALKTIRNRYISLVDVVSWSERSVTVHDESVVVHEDELARLREILKKPRRFLGQQVVTANGDFVGVLYDFAFDTTLATLTSLYTAKSFLFVKYDRRIIAAKQIVEITTQAIVIKDSYEKLPMRRLNLETC